MYQQQISATETKRKLFRQQLRRKTINQEMRNVRNYFLAVSNSQQRQNGCCDDRTNNIGKYKEEQRILEEGIVGQKQSLLTKQFLERLKNSLSVNNADSNQKIEVILMRMSSIEPTCKQWTQQLLQIFVSIVTTGVQRYNLSPNSLITISQNCQFQQKKLFYQVFLSTQVVKKILVIQKKQLMYDIVQIFKNFYSKAPTICHQQNTQQQLLVVSFSQISQLGCLIIKQQSLSLPLINQYLDLFLVMLLRNGRREKKTILYKGFSCHTYQFLGQILNRCDNEWNIRIRYKIISVCREIITGGWQVNLQIFYRTVSWMQKFILTQFDYFYSLPEESDSLFNKILQTFQLFLVDFLTLNQGQILLGANYLLQKNEKKFTQLINFLLKSAIYLKICVRFKICDLILFLAHYKLSFLNNEISVVCNICDFSMQMLGIDCFCPSIIGLLLEVLTIFLKTLEMRQVLNKIRVCLPRILEKIDLQNDNTQILQKVQIIQKLLDSSSEIVSV